MDDQNKNLILAIALSALVMLSWTYFFPAPEPVVDPNATEVTSTSELTGSGTVAASDGQVAAVPAETTSEPQAEAPRIEISSDRLSGSLSLRGGRIDFRRRMQILVILQAASPMFEA